ncbi:MAG TPA: Crp/Fnr family transcriptional regulator [bacterium]|nr:Crp/Fnr family transcriptional regulator [bacterium]HOL47333.1 Crp/Fnr family transcriptional regulator [bacterium]HPQ17961.1 Crp/Fnr family transcriptional regulator [bacterium]
MKKEYFSFFNSIKLFNGIDENILKIFANIAIEEEYKEGRYIIKKNEISDSLFIIYDGYIEIEQSNEQGESKILAILKKGDCFGEIGFLTGKPRSASARTLQPTKLLIIKRADFQKEILQNPDLILNIIEILSERLLSANEQIKTLTFKTIAGRLSYELLTLSKNNGIKTDEGIKINLPITHQFLGELIGTAREVVTRIISKFKKEGSIKIDNKYITIIDEEKLKKWN